MSYLMLTCPWCQSKFMKAKKEVTRQKKKRGDDTLFFCSNSCGGYYKGSLIPKKEPETIVCPCGVSFQTLTGSKHCSRNCASKYSVSEARKLVFSKCGHQNRFKPNDFRQLQMTANGLRVREWNKYTLIDMFLEDVCIEHQFEYALEGTRYIYDLVLFNEKLFIEFDEYYHMNDRQRQIDEQKDQAAMVAGYKVRRIKVINTSSAYTPNLLREVLAQEGIDVLKPLLLATEITTRLRNQSYTTQ